MKIQAVKFYKNGFMTEPFAFGGEDGMEAFDAGKKYRSCLQNYVIDTGDEVILVDTGLPADFPEQVPDENTTIYLGDPIKPYMQNPITVLPLAFLGLFEGFVHIFAIRLFRCQKFYSPGLVTAEIQAIVTIVLFSYLIKNNILSGIDYLIGALIMCACFVLMQKTITQMVGIKYSDLPKMLKKQLAKK